jgi:hypothetical protein
VISRKQKHEGGGGGATPKLGIFEIYTSLTKYVWITTFGNEIKKRSHFKSGKSLGSFHLKNKKLRLCVFEKSS